MIYPETINISNKVNIQTPTPWENPTHHLSWNKITNEQDDNIMIGRYIAALTYKEKKTCVKTDTSSNIVDAKK